MKKLGTKTLETDRLVLRKFRIDDANEVFANYGNDDEVTKYLRWPTYKNVEAVTSYLGNVILGYDDLNNYNWAIELNSNGEVIGNISVVEMQANRNQVEIGYVLSKKYWGKGIAVEALKRVINFLIEEVKVNKITLKADTRNLASLAVAKKAGMELVEVTIQDFKNNSGVCDLAHFEIKKPRSKKNAK